MTISASDRRATILRAASRLFEHYGHGKTTIADVAREAGVGVGSVYLEFASKEAIVEELSSSTHVGVLDAMRAAIRGEDDAPKQLTAALLARTRAFVELRSKGEHACELVHCKAESVRAAHDRFREQERVFLEVIVQRGQAKGAFASCEPTFAATLVQRAFASLSPPWIFGSDEDALRAASDLCTLLLHGLLVDKDTRAFVREARAGARADKPAPKGAKTPSRTPARRR